MSINVNSIPLDEPKSITNINIERDNRDNMMNIDRPSIPSTNNDNITTIEIFDSSNINNKKRLNNQFSDKKELLNHKDKISNKKIKYIDDENKKDETIKPIFNTSMTIIDDDMDDVSPSTENNKYEEDFKIIQNNTREWNDVKLTSILNLRSIIDQNDNKGLSNFFHNHTFVGCVDETLALIQYQTKLYLVNYQETSRELFYQLTLRQFSNFGFINLTQKLPIYDLLMISLEAEEEENGWDENLQSKEEIAENITQLLIEKREMLLEYFSITIDQKGNLETLPILLKGYIPNMDKLPGFLLRLGIECDWEEEQECFRTVSQEISIFYSTEAPIIDDNLNNNNNDDDNDDGDDNNNNNSFIVDETEKNSDIAKFYWTIQHIIFPALKKETFKGCNRLVEERYIMEIANLHDLYRIFERC
ncbi:hypothetical protein BCR32DRAFT_234585 [Anaeromyces robustus]|uniref:DNA mismatch repair protein Mlh1 C-terminal domain-containing protein n=1 Tax=Anaeromyces robustus TaxID=1754192 RepID=A0A1Y1WZP8_9FUNG|nr:hypothetical protein BCR32DRAFT_234585 [Anaeromyces robustus]|eukprot:ORX79020.1 hypothetical protein BCR32DRAFT_234585 [Anaeromyces robustus]